MAVNRLDDGHRLKKGIDRHCPLLCESLCYCLLCQILIFKKSGSHDVLSATFSSLDGMFMAFVLFLWVPLPSPSDNSIMESPSTSSVGPTLVSSLSSTSSTDTCLDNAGVDGIGVDVVEA